jgi:hypothetical protein
MRDERVVRRQAAHGHVEHRTFPRCLDIRCEHAGGRLRRAGADAPRVEDEDSRAAARELMSDSAANDTGADDDDVSGVMHGEIIARAALQSMVRMPKRTDGWHDEHEGTKNTKNKKLRALRFFVIIALAGC